MRVAVGLGEAGDLLQMLNLEFRAQPIGTAPLISPPCFSSVDAFDDLYNHARRRVNKQDIDPMFAILTNTS